MRTKKLFFCRKKSEEAQVVRGFSKTEEEKLKNYREYPCWRS